MTPSLMRISIPRRPPGLTLAITKTCTEQTRLPMLNGASDVSPTISRILPSGPRTGFLHSFSVPKDRECWRYVEYATTVRAAPVSTKKSIAPDAIDTGIQQLSSL